QLLHSFPGPNLNSAEGYNPIGGLTLSGTALYGTTSVGGPNGSGTVYRLNTDGTGYQILHTFPGDALDSNGPYSGVTLGGSVLYGTTPGGPAGHGVVYSMNTDGTGFQILHAFNGGAGEADGSWCGVTLGGSVLYGMTHAGGANGLGTVYRVNTDG